MFHASGSWAGDDDGEGEEWVGLSLRAEELPAAGPVAVVGRGDGCADGDDGPAAGGVGSGDS